MKNQTKTQTKTHKLNQSDWKLNIVKTPTATKLKILNSLQSSLPKGVWNRRGLTIILLAIFASTSTLWVGSEAQAQAHDEAPRELSGLSASEAFDVKDGLELDPNSPLVKRLLYRVQKTSYESRAAACKYSDEVTWQELKDHTVDYRFWMMRRRMMIQRIEKHSIPGATEDDSIENFFICDGTATPTLISNENSAQTDNASPENVATIPCRVITRTLPRELPIGQAINEPVEFEGFLYAQVLDDAVAPADQTDNRQPSFVFVSDRLAWYPDQTTHASQAHVVLAELGFDVSLLDTARSNQGKTLQTSDSEAFFGLLNAMRNSTGDQAISRKAMPRRSLTDVMSDSSSKLGSAIQMSAVCRSCTRIEIPYPDVQHRLGIDHYYQLILFPKLDRKVVMTEGDKKVELDRYAVTVCCTALPEGMEPKDIERRQVSIDGFFYRIWKFKTEKTDMADISGTVSPLIVASTPTVMASSTAELNRFVVYFVLGIIGIIGISLIYLRFSDRMQQKNHNSESVLDTLPDRIDTEGLDTD